MKREGKPGRRRSAQKLVRRQGQEPKVEVSGGANVEAESVDVGGDIVGRDKLLSAGDDIVQGDQYKNIGAGAAVVGRGGRLTQVRQTIINWPRSTKIAVAAVAAGLLVVLAGVGVPRLREAGILPQPLACDPAGPDQFLVVVAEFYTESDSRAFVTERLAPRIDEVLNENYVENARVVAETLKPKDQKEAHDIARRCNASVIVWGKYDRNLFAHVDVIQSTFFASLGLEAGEQLVAKETQTVGDVPISPETLSAQIGEGVAPKINYLVLYTVGRVHYWRAYKLLEVDRAGKEKEYGFALRLFKRAIDELEGVSNEDLRALGADVLFFSRGYVYLNLADLGAADASYEKALEDFKHAVEINPDNHAGHFALGYVYADKLGLLEAALEPFSRAVGSPRREVAVEAWFNMGLAHYSLDKTADAERSWNQALALDDRALNPLRALGFLKYEQGNYEQSVAFTQRAIDANPEDEKPEFEVEVLCNLGLAHIAASNQSSAVAAYDRAIALSTMYPKASVGTTLKICQTDLSDLLSVRPELSASATHILDRLSAAAANLSVPPPERTP